MFVRLYSKYVRPHLEFSTQAWSPWTEGDKMTVEKVQRKAIGMVSGLKAQTYEERLKELGLQTLEERRHQADMFMVHKIIHTSGGLQSETWFEMAGDSADALNEVMHGVLLFTNRSSSRSVRLANGLQITTPTAD